MNDTKQKICGTRVRTWADLSWLKVRSEPTKRRKGTDKPRVGAMWILPRLKSREILTRYWKTTKSVSSCRKWEKGGKCFCPEKTDPRLNNSPSTKETRGPGSVMTAILNTERSMVRTGTTSKFLTIKPGKLSNSRSSGSKKQHGFLNGDEMTREQTAVTSFLRAAEIQIPRPSKSPSAPIPWTSSSTVFLSEKA